MTKVIKYITCPLCGAAGQLLKKDLLYCPACCRTYGPKDVFKLVKAQKRLDELKRKYAETH